MIIKRTIEQEVKICDTCKSAWNKDTDLPTCFICGKDVCFTCKENVGEINLCLEHHKWIWKQIKNKKKELQPPNETQAEQSSVS